MNIDDFSFHDAIIVSVQEDTYDQCLDFLMDFPTDWENNVIEKRILRFSGVIHYAIDEIPFQGHPAVLKIINLGDIKESFGTGINAVEKLRTKIEIQTNAGRRVIEFQECFLINTEMSNQR